MALCLELYWEYASAGYGMSGMWAVWCDPPPRLFTKGRLYAIYYANYLVKVPGSIRPSAWNIASMCLRGDAQVYVQFQPTRHQPPVR